MSAPTINVNLSRCWCPDPHHRQAPSMEQCKPVLVALRLPPSATFRVRLGECSCLDADQVAAGSRVAAPEHAESHTFSCAHRAPVSVSCSISGKTWAESEVTDFESSACTSRYGDQCDVLGAACRERWVLVKVLVLGESWDRSKSEIATLFTQRDAVFKAIADMARAEEAAERAQRACDAAFPYSRHATQVDSDHRQEPPSMGRLAAYLQHVLEQVQVLP